MRYSISTSKVASERLSSSYKNTGLIATLTLAPTSRSRVSCRHRLVSEIALPNHLAVTRTSSKASAERSARITLGSAISFVWPPTAESNTKALVKKRHVSKSTERSDKLSAQPESFLWSKVTPRSRRLGYAQSRGHCNKASSAPKHSSNTRRPA